MPARPARRSMSIGAVLAALKPDFPDVSISKIRFLEAEGLVTPERTGSGYRTFSDDDVERLRYILTAQRDRFWPLKVIRESLDALDRGLTPDVAEPAHPRAPRPADDPDVPKASALTAASQLRLTREELASASGLGEETLAALESFGLVRTDSGGHYGESSLSVAHIAAGLVAYGIEPRHLRPFRNAADREIGLVEQATSPHRGKAQSGRQKDPTGEILRLCIALHTALVKDGLEHR